MTAPRERGLAILEVREGGPRVIDPAPSCVHHRLDLLSLGRELQDQPVEHQPSFGRGGKPRAVAVDQAVLRQRAQARLVERAAVDGGEPGQIDALA